MVPGKTQPVSLPRGGTVSVKLVEARQGAATFEVSAPGSRTQSRVTVPPGKRIVQQVSAEQGGSAWFVTIKAGGVEGAGGLNGAIIQGLGAHASLTMASSRRLTASRPCSS